MPSIKIDIRKQYGAFKAKFYDARSSVEEQDFANLKDVLTFMRDNAAELDLDGGDDVVFRGIAYTSISALEREIKGAPF